MTNRNTLSMFAALAGLALAASSTLAGGNGGNGNGNNSGSGTTTGTSGSTGWGQGGGMWGSGSGSTLSSRNAGGIVSSGSMLKIYGVTRDFRSDNVAGGHPDFNTTYANGRGIYLGMTTDNLDADGKPVFASTGAKAATMALDSSNRAVIGAKSYLSGSSNDNPASMTTDSGACDSKSSFDGWYQDGGNTLATNALGVPFSRVNGVWTADLDLNTIKQTGTGANNNYGYTFEMEASFAFHSSNNNLLRFGADDALWVYVDGRLVIDLGGDHAYAEQVIDLSRLSGLEEGKRYHLKVFYAERTKQDSRFVMQVPFDLNNVERPQVSAMFD